MTLDEHINDIVGRYTASGIEQQVDYEKFYLYSIITHSTAIEGSTITEIENQLLFDEGVSPANHTLVEQMMNLDLRDAYLKWLPAIKAASTFTDDTLRGISASVMRRTGSVYSTALGEFDSSRGDYRLVNVRAGMSGRSYMGFQKVAAKTAEFCRWLTQEVQRVDRADAVAKYRLSFAAHYRLVTIHPWVDGNGRAARLLMNALQHRFGVPMSKITSGDKAAYIQTLVDAREADDETIFVDYAMRRVAADLEKELLAFLDDTNPSE